MNVSRELWNLIEPIASSVYFVPEAHEAYGELGLPGFGGGYFCSRAACMGKVPAEVVVATFGVFNPAVVHPSVEEGWSKTDPETILGARLRGATAGLRRMLGAVDEPSLQRATEIMNRAADAAPTAGRPLFAGLRSLGFPGDPIGDMWRAADTLREHRGDSHIAAWVAHGIDAVEINLLTELWWGIRIHSYVKTRGWGPDDVEAALARLRRRGLIDDDNAFTPDGERVRASIETATDEGERQVVEAIGDDAEELFALLRPWTRAVLDAKGYPRDPASVDRR
jgi:hypothetical protein